MNNTLTMRHPASWYGQPGKDGIPLGNGKTGAMVEGGAGTEEIIFNRYDLWHDAYNSELPDLSDSIFEIRKLIDCGEYAKANEYLYHRINQSGYISSVGSPMILGALRMAFTSKGLFSDYRRKLYMDKGECEVSYRQREQSVKRRCFISRDDGMFYYEFDSTENTDISLIFGVYDDHTENYDRICNMLAGGVKTEYSDDGIVYRVNTGSLIFGAKLRIYGAESKCVFKDGKHSLDLHGKHFGLTICFYSGADQADDLHLPTDFSYDECLSKHTKLYRRLYHTADIRFGNTKEHSNEELLDEAYDQYASPELIEKMWRFGRYLFICGTCEDGNPFPLYGLWHTKYYPQWPQNVANENVEIIYWHTVVGGLSALVKPLIHYYSSAIGIFENSAKKLFGCHGIFVGAYTTPANKNPAVLYPVIVNFTGVAGWLSQHFFKYYCMTADKKTLEEEIFPFMLGAADFYLDYIRYDKDGKVIYYPCVSPENTPTNLIDPKIHYKMHQNPVTKNAVIELAIIKDLFKNLQYLIRETGQHTDYLPRLHEVLAKIPEYTVNEDGAIKEWVADELKDRYAHRHLSHIFPLFPGEEVTEDDNPELFKAFARAVELREPGSQCSWSLSHASSVYATLGMGEKAIECLDTLIKGCTLNNFTTLYNDYRNMGAVLPYEAEKEIPVQMDANMGFVNAVQKMIFDERAGYIALLPALPKRLDKGIAKNLCFSIGRASLRWNLHKRSFSAEIRFTRSGNIKLKVPKGFTEKVAASDGRFETDGCYTVLFGQKNTVFKISGVQDIETGN